MKPKALVVCNGGHVRSPTLARLLDKRGWEAQPCGWEKEWALRALLAGQPDVVFAMDQRCAERVLEAGWLGPIVLDYDVGPDDWKVPDHPDLLRRLRDLVEQQPPAKPAWA